MLTVRLLNNLTPSDYPDTCDDQVLTIASNKSLGEGSLSNMLNKYFYVHAYAPCLWIVASL